MEINIARLEQNLQKLGEFGRNKDDGIDRSLGSQADYEARNWLIEQGKLLGARVTVDAVANIWMRLEGTDPLLPPITVGSHHDAVANGGLYDGALGVLLGLEIMATLKEQGMPLKHAYQVVSFTAEEPNPFMISTMGSRSVSGKLSKEILKGAYSRENQKKLSQVILENGGNLEELEHSQLKQGSMEAFIECHIEQGRHLFEQRLPAAVVSVITGIYRETVKVFGEANHAGTTRMEHRHDALLAAAEGALALEEIVKKINRLDVTATVGTFSVFPNSANIIPGQVEFILDVRVPDEAIKEQIISAFGKAVERIEKKRNLQIQRSVLLDQLPVKMDIGIQKLLAESLVEQTGVCLADIPTQYGAPSLVSLAGHDAVHMSNFTRTAMLFVQSKDGKSHCPQEATDIEDILVAGNGLLQTILKLDAESPH